jgi:hypothetical protein
VSNVYKRVLAILQQTIVNSEVMKQGCWLLGNLMRGKPAPPLSYVINTKLEFFHLNSKIKFSKIFS